jgi:hypothetical protein
MRLRLLVPAAVLAMLILPSSVQAQHAPPAAKLRASAWSSIAQALDRPAGIARAVANTNPATFTDTSNDGGTAPDIRTVVVSNDAAGKYTFRINVGQLTLPSNVLILVLMDTDQNATTGNAGFDYVFACDESNGSFALLQWNGSSLVAAPATTFSVTDDSTGLTASFNKSDIGNSSAMNFAVASVEGGQITAGHTDFGPDSGVWNYAQGAAAPLALTASSARAPRTVKHGKSFIVVMLAARSDTGEYVNDETGGATACKATVAGKPVKLLAAGFVESASPELAACQFRAPKNAKRKVIRGSITVTLQDASVKKTFSVRVT